jgi:hypothetical protein
MSNNQPQEGNATVAKIPSMVYLCAGLSALAASACMMCRGRKSTALLVGQWAAPLLIMGLYNKVVKTEGHDGSATKSPIKPNH